MRTTTVEFRAATRGVRSTPTTRRHSLPVCEATGLARFRDRHQARAGANALSSAAATLRVDTFACPDCRGWHVEKDKTDVVATGAVASVPTAAFTDSLNSRKRRYFLIDIENPTRGAKAGVDEVATFWSILKQQAPGVAPHDHVVVGASRSVARKYRPVISGHNVKWVIGANAPDAADCALLAAIDLRRVARDYDELVIVSGDHAFADLARRAKTSGLTVHVVTAEHPENRSMLARELAAAADVRTVARLRGRTQRKRTIQATRAMSAAWRSRDQQTLAA